MNRDLKQRIADYVALLPMSVKHPVLDQLEEFAHELVRRLTDNNGPVRLRTVPESNVVTVHFMLSYKDPPRQRPRPTPVILFEASFNAANGPVDIKVMESETVACKDLNQIYTVIWEQLEKIENRRTLYRFATKPIQIDDDEESEDADQVLENG